MLSIGKRITGKGAPRVVKKAVRAVKKSSVKAVKASKRVPRKIQDIKSAVTVRGQRAAKRKNTMMKKLAKKKIPQIIDKINFEKIQVISISGTSDDGRSVTFTFNISDKDKLQANRNPAYKYFTLT